MPGAPSFAIVAACAAPPRSGPCPATTTSPSSTRCACAARARPTSRSWSPSFLAFFVGDGERHFRAEEEVLLPLVPADAEPAGRRLTRDHAEIRRRARALGEQPDRDAAAELGELLAAHVRFEERELFPLLEARLDRAGARGRRAPAGPSKHGGR